MPTNTNSNVVYSSELLSDLIARLGSKLPDIFESSRVCCRFEYPLFIYPCDRCFFMAPMFADASCQRS